MNPSEPNVPPRMLWRTEKPMLHCPVAMGNMVLGYLDAENAARSERGELQHGHKVNA